MSKESVAPCCAASRSPGGAFVPVEVPLTSSPEGPTDGMVLVDEGEFLMGSDHPRGFPADGEGPVRKVVVDPFYIDASTVTNAQFAEFVEETGYKTEAERFGWSFVYSGLVPPAVAEKVTQAVAAVPWWWPVQGAFWCQPEGPGSSIDDRMDHPAVHVSWDDAVSYCRWAGKRLPTEAEWEMAARGGPEQKAYPWGDELTPHGEHMCNIWQGQFPSRNSAEDGYVSTAPATSFPPNGYGLFNVSGNVWEWCSDWFSPSHHVRGPRKNPMGPPHGEGRVIKGGSYICHESYCNRYRMGARTFATPDTSAAHQGFRCVRDA